MSPKYLHFKILLFVFILQIMSSVLVPVLNAPEKLLMTINYQIEVNNMKCLYK